MTEQTNETTREIRKMPESADGSNIYPLQTEIGIIPVTMDQLDDLATGGKRHKKFGAYFSAHIVPNLSTAAIPGQPVLVPKAPSAFIDADSLEALRERIMYEVDLMIDSAKEIVESGQLEKAEQVPDIKLADS